MLGLIRRPVSLVSARFTYKRIFNKVPLVVIRQKKYSSQAENTNVNILSQYTQSVMDEATIPRLFKDFDPSVTDKILNYFESRKEINGDDNNTALHLVAQYGSATDLRNAISLFKNFINAKNSDGVTPFIIAASRTDPEISRVLVENGANRDAITDRGYAALHFASATGSPETILSLINNYNMDVNIQTPQGATPLMSATSPENAQTLIDKGADIKTKTTEGRTALHFAAESGEVELIKFLVEKGADIEATDESGETPLFFAARGNSYEAMKMLLDLGANVHVNALFPLISIVAVKGNDKTMDLIAPLVADINIDPKGAGTPLHLAASFGHTSVISVLLKHGAKITTTTQQITPLHEAAKNGHCAAIEVLVKGGDDLDAKDYVGYTSIAMAVMNGHVKAVELLVKLGANVDTRNAQGRTLMFFASSLEMMETIVKSGASVNAKDNDGNTPILAAAKQGHFELLEPLVKAGARIDELDANGYTPLHLAVLNDVVEPIAPLIKAGANVNGVNPALEPPISTAANHPTPLVLEELLKFKPDVNAVFKGFTPLFVAGHPETVKMLVKAGADINFKSQEDMNTVRRGASPLHTIAVLRDGETARAMVEHGANLEAQTEHGHTPLMLSCLNVTKDFSVYKTLVKLGANINHIDKHGNTMLHHAAESENMPIIKDLIKRGLDWKAKNRMQQRPLHGAASTGCIEALLLFAKMGGDIQEPDAAGDTPMHYAVNGRSIEMVKKLVEIGADIEPINNMGWSPLVFAGFADSSMIPFFVQQGADINRRDKNGNTPMHLAIIHAGNRESVKEFLKAGADRTIRNNNGLRAEDEANMRDASIASLFS